MFHRSVAAAVLGAALMLAPAARADSVTIYSGGAVKSGLEEAARRYERQSGAKIAIEFHPMGPLLKLLASGAKPDVVVLTDDVWPQAEKQAAVDTATRIEVGRVGIGVAVHENAPAPDISTPEALKAALLAAKSVVYIDPARGTSGKHFAGVLQQLGIADAVNAKTKFGSGGYVVEPVGRGEIELGVHQITEILPVKGVKLVGPLPPPLQKETIYFAAVTPSTANRQAAAAFLAYLRTPAVRALFAERGFIEK